MSTITNGKATKFAAVAGASGQRVRDYAAAILQYAERGYATEAIARVNELNTRLSGEAPETGSGVTAVSLTYGGAYVSLTAGQYTATQASTDGSGTFSTYTVTSDGGTLTSVDAVLTGGENHEVGDVITLDIAGSLEVAAATVTVTAIG